METQSQTELVADGLQRIKDAADFLGVSRSFIYRLITEGVLPTVRIGRSRRIPIRAVHELAVTNLQRSDSSSAGNENWDILLFVGWTQSRDNKTPLELFLAGVRALALQSRIIDVVRIASRFSSGTGGH